MQEETGEEKMGQVGETSTGLRRAVSAGSRKRDVNKKGNGSHAQ